MNRSRPTTGAQARPTEPATVGGERVGPPRDTTVCPRCGESVELVKVKGCVQCLSCHFKFDCNGW
jgi:hypothetical protein